MTALAHIRGSILLPVLVTVSACGGADPSPGLEALIQVSEAGPKKPPLAQFYAGGLPAPNGGPDVKGLSSSNNRVFPGYRAGSLSGRVADTVNPDGSIDAVQAVLIGLDGDAGYWVVPTGPIDPTETNQRTFDARVAFSREMPIGMARLSVSAVGKNGKVGTPLPFIFAVADNVPSGQFVVVLDWDADADLDLHLVLPNPQLADFPTIPTVEVWSGHQTSYRRVSGSSLSASELKDALKSAAVLDHDSNGQCVIDGRREEAIVIEQDVPRGHYVVRVDTPNLCGQPATRWRVRLFANGILVPGREAKGIASPYDGYPVTVTTDAGAVAQPGTEGAGQRALEFDL